MASTGQAPESEHGLNSYIDQFTRITPLLVLIYGIGFFILAVYEAHFGIFQFSPLRARIFLVGFAFTVLVALPAAAQYYGLAYFGPLKPILENTNPALKTYRGVVLGLGFVYTAYLIASFFNLFLFVPMRAHPIRWWTAGAMVAGYLVLLAAYSVIGKKFATHPKFTTVAALASTGIFLAGLYFYNETLETLTFWFLFAAMFVGNVQLNSDRLRFALDFRNWISVVGLLLLYVLAIFGAMQPKFGGGAPMPVTLYFSKPVAWFDSALVTVSLMDETDQGFYVLAPGKNKALFIPRSDVSSVYFGSAEDLPKSK